MICVVDAIVGKYTLPSVAILAAPPAPVASTAYPADGLAGVDGSVSVVELTVDASPVPLIVTVKCLALPINTHFAEYVIDVPVRFAEVGVHVPSSYAVMFAVPPRLMPLGKYGVFVPVGTRM